MVMVMGVVVGVQGHQEAERGGERDEGEEAEGWQEVEGPECAEAAADGFLHLLVSLGCGADEGKVMGDGVLLGGKAGGLMGTVGGGVAGTSFGRYSRGRTRT